MKPKKHHGFNTKFLTTFAFTLATLFVLSLYPFVGVLAIDFAIAAVLWISLSTIAGLVTNDSGLAYYVSLTSGLALILATFFPFRYTDPIGMWLFSLMAGAGVGSFLGLCAYIICKTVQSVLRGERQVSGRRILFYFLTLVGFSAIGGLGAYVFLHRADVVAYLDQHTWVVTLVGIIVTFLTAFFGRGYYDRRREKEG